MKQTDWKARAKEWAYILLAGMIAHFALYSNWLTNPDGMAVFGEYYANGWEISLGRFMLPVLDRIRDGMNAPILNVVFGMALFAMAAVIINEVLQIKNAFLRYAAAICVVSAPLIANLASYYFMFLEYGISMLAVVYSVYFLMKVKGWYAIPVSSVLLMISLGLYQSSLGVAAGLCAMVLILKLFDKAEKWSDIGKQFLRFMIYGIIGVGLYYGILKIVLNVKDIAIADYAGIGSFGISAFVGNFAQGIRQAYVDFAAYFYGDTIMSNAYYVKEAYWILSILSAAAMAVHLIFNGKKVGRSLMAMALLAVLPIVCNCTVLIAANTTIILRTAWGMLMVVPFMGKLIWDAGELLAKKARRIPFGKILKGVAGAACCILVVGNAAIDNMDALIMKTEEQKYTQLSNRICMDVEKNSYYQAGNRVAIIGVPVFGNYPTNVMTDHSGYVPGYVSVYKKTNYYAQWGLLWNTPNMVYAGWKNIFTFQLGMNLNWCDEWEFNGIIETPEFSAMPNYPEEGSTAVINDVLVIKVSDM
ncbi:MAG: glucosyltransferase domain-containing protein [Eubacteriales bacterium]|nr:glucosyltransferase domain-containing protein [Eubacteriales bacterium]